MGEKNTQIVIGCFLQDIKGKLPFEEGEDYWLDWFDKNCKSLSSFAKFVTSYESEPTWIGFRIVALEYQQLWTDTGSRRDVTQATWKIFREYLLRTHGTHLPEGQLIVAHDEGIR